MSHDVSAYVPVPVPTNQMFCTQWHAWVHGKVARHFKRDKERILDTAQNVRLRLLTKDFIGRWFFKHLREELVDKTQAERILGGVPVTFVGSIQPFAGRRSAPESLWRVSDLLDFARFDYERYYYSIQNHTIDSEKVLRLLGVKPGRYSVLQSMYRQGRLLPAELTEHGCRRRGHIGAPPSSCPGCVHGTSLLRARSLSLAHDWMDPSIAVTAAKLRWNDSQLAPFLRDWRKANTVFATPQFIMRTSPKPGIIAGLLKYAEMVIDHEVYNDFKRMARSDDISCTVLNKSVSPEYSDSESMAWEGGREGEETKERVMRDMRSMTKFASFEDAHDLARMLESSGLTDEELDAVKSVDLGEMTVRQYAETVGKPVPRVHRVRASAIRKLRGEEDEPLDVHGLASEIADRHGCSVADMVGPGMIGPHVVARTEFFAALYDAGLTVQAIAVRFAFSEDRVASAIARAGIRESRVTG